MEKYPHLDDTFFSVFTAWFHVDLIPDDDEIETLKLAGICASDLHRKKRNLGGIAQDLSEMLARWDSKNAMPFIDATTVDWLADEKTEKLLRKILEQLVIDLKYFTK